MGSLAIRSANSLGGPGMATHPVDARGIKYPANITAHAFSVTIASAGTVATAWLPATGRRFRVTSYVITSSAADTVFLRGVSSTNFLLTHKLAANSQLVVPDLRWGISCASANSALVVDAGTAATVVTGTIFGDEVP